MRSRTKQDAETQRQINENKKAKHSNHNTNAGVNPNAPTKNDVIALLDKLSLEDGQDVGTRPSLCARYNNMLVLCASDSNNLLFVELLNK